MKILSFNGKIPIAWGALANLEYTLRVTETETGTVETYHNPAGTYGERLDQDAF